MSIKQKKIKVGILGYTSELAKELKSFIEEEDIFNELIFHFYDLNAKDEYSILGDFREESIVVKYPEIEDLKEDDILILASNLPQNDDIVKLYNSGVVIDIANSLKTYTLLYKGEEKETLISSKIIKLPEPSSFILYKILNPIKKSFGIEWVMVNIFYPASSKEGGIDNFVDQIFNSLNMQPINKEIFNEQIAFSFAPIDEELEDRIKGETRELLGFKNIGVESFFASVFHSFSFFIHFKTLKPIEEDIFKYSFESENFFRFSRKRVTSPLEAAGNTKIDLSFLRKVKDIENTYFLNASADNFKVGIILSTVEILKKLTE